MSFNIFLHRAISSEMIIQNVLWRIIHCDVVYDIDCGNLYWLALMCGVCHCEMLYSEMVANSRLNCSTGTAHTSEANVV